MKIIFIGTPEFGAIILEKLCKANLKPVLVVTASDKPVGRKQILTPSSVKIIAQRYKIKVGQTMSSFREIKPELVLVAAFGQILPEEILEIPKYGCLNVHPSLLPKYRGAAPVQFAILNGEKETGATIFLMDAEVDHGPILAQRKTVIGPNETMGQLQSRLAVLGAELLIDAIPDWIRGKIRLRRQDERRATYTGILKKEDGKIDWRKSAKIIERQIRAFDPWPGSWTYWQILKGKLIRIKILKARIFSSAKKTTYSIGKVLVVPQNEIGIQCGKDILVVKMLQIEGKKITEPEDFLRGHPDFIRAILKF